MTSTAKYLILVAASAVLLASTAPVAPGLAGTSDSGISGVVLQAGCRHVRPCQRTATRPFVQVARVGGSVVATARIRNFRFHLALQPGKYLVRLVRAANAVGTGGRLVTVRPHAYTIVALRT
jgi:di/tricarboxylate transporter